MLGIDHLRVLRQNGRPLHHVLQFPYISFPWIGFKNVDRFLAKDRGRHLQSGRQTLQKMLRQSEDVLAPLRERGQFNGKRGQP